VTTTVDTKFTLSTAQWFQYQYTSATKTMASQTKNQPHAHLIRWY